MPTRGKILKHQRGPVKKKEKKRERKRKELKR
jgi:hypothetical protein